MKNNLRFLLSGLLVLLILFSCKNQPENNVVALEPTQKEKLELERTIRIIKLETKPESNMGFISKTAIDFASDRIFVLADDNIFIFNSSGKFISKLKKGRGPGEINMITSFSLDIKSRLLYAMDNASRICILDYNGKMENDYPLESVSGIIDIQYLDDKNVFLFNFRAYKENPWFVGVYNLKTEKIMQKLIPREESLYPELAMIKGKNFMTAHGRQFFSCCNVFGLYEYENNDFQKIFSFELGERQVPNSFSKKIVENRERIKFRELAHDNKYVPFLLSSFYYKNYYWAVIDDKQSSCYAISDEKKRKVYMNGPISSYFNLPDVKSFKIPSEVEEDFLVFAGNPTDFFRNISQSDKTIVEIDKLKFEIGLEDNSFLVVVE